MIDLDAATAFMTVTARVLDRRRFERIAHGAAAEGVVAALGAYRNADGGFGWAIEPDLRSASSQPVGAMHAFEVLHECAPTTSSLAGEVCDWLEHVTLDDGGLPFVCAGADGAGTAPWWAHGDPTSSSLHITAAVCSHAWALAGHDAQVEAHPWLHRATAYCLQAVTDRDDAPASAYETKFVLALFDQLVPRQPELAPTLERIAARIPPSGQLPVEGGLEDEALRPLDLSPSQDGALRSYVSAEVIASDLDRLASEQQPDGGWTVDFNPVTPAARLAWRGYATVRAIALLKAHGRLTSG